MFVFDQDRHLESWRSARCRSLMLNTEGPMPTASAVVPPEMEQRSNRLSRRNPSRIVSAGKKHPERAWPESFFCFLFFRLVPCAK